MRLTGWTFDFVHSANAINVSNSSFANLGQLTSQNVGYGIIETTYSAYGWSSVMEESDGVWKWVVPPAASGVAYIRVSAFDNTGDVALSGSKLIITKNEEISK